MRCELLNLIICLGAFCRWEGEVERWLRYMQVKGRMRHVNNIFFSLRSQSVRAEAPLNGIWERDFMRIVLLQKSLALSGAALFADLVHFRPTEDCRQIKNLISGFFLQTPHRFVRSLTSLYWLEATIHFYNYAWHFPIEALSPNYYLRERFHLWHKLRRLLLFFWSNFILGIFRCRTLAFGPFIVWSGSIKTRLR